MPEDLVPSVVAMLLFTALAGKYDNHFWRTLLLVVHFFVAPLFVQATGWLPTLLALATRVSILMVPMFANLQYQKRKGCVLVTGCDSGMGQATVVHLAKTNIKNSPGNQYSQIFAGCFNPKASQEYFEKTLSKEELKYVTVVPLDVTSDASVEMAAQTIQTWRQEHQTKNPSEDYGVTGLCMYHGIAYNGPAEYMPLDMYERQIQVNFLGFLRVNQKMLPLMKDHASPSLPGRIIMTGTGGGPCSPCPPLLTAYMSSKFATEAYCQSLRQELYMSGSNIEACIINPGFVKPTMLMEEGKKLTNKMWEVCEKKIGSTKAKDAFGPLMDHFIEYSALQPGTHVSEVYKAAEHALLAPVPRSSYKVGVDSKLAPIVGMLPTGVRETIARHGIYGFLSPAGTVKGYRV